MSMKDMREIVRCVICGRGLRPKRKHVDTCGERCFKLLLERQRAILASEVAPTEEDSDHKSLQRQ